MTNNPWLSETFRLTSFFQTSERIDPSQWWESVVGETPEKRNSQPKLGIFQDEGPYANGYLVLAVKPGRVDWLFFSAFDKQTGMPDLQNLPPYQASKEVFLQVANRWFGICPAIVRIAFGLILYIPVPNKIAGYSGLSTYLSTVQIDPENSTDFLYQINRRRPSKNIPGLLLNRLSKWSVATLENFQVPMNGIAFDASRFRREQSYFVRLELDINTAQERKEVIPDEKYTLILLELIDLAFEIAEKGDIV